MSPFPAKETPAGVETLSGRDVHPPEPNQSLKDKDQSKKIDVRKKSVNSSSGVDTPTSSLPPNVLRALLVRMTENLEVATRNSTAAAFLPYPQDNVKPFTGRDVTLFLERYKEIAKYYAFNNKDMIKRVTAYCKPKPRATITTSKEYDEALESGTWATFQEFLRKRFQDNDRIQQEERREYFEYWLSQCQSREGLNVGEYLQEFQVRSKRCINAGTLQASDQGMYLIKGLPQALRFFLIEKFDFEISRPNSFDYKQLRDYLLRRIRMEEDARVINPAEAIKVYDAEVEFKVDKITNPMQRPAQIQAEEQEEETHSYAPFRAPRLNLPRAGETLNGRNRQAPPGAVPTRSEVDDLADKLTQLKINKASFVNEPWRCQWTPREAELMDMPIVRGEVERQSNKRAGQTGQYTNKQGLVANQQRYYPQDQGSYAQLAPNHSANTYPQRNQDQQNGPQSGYNQSTQGFQQRGYQNSGRSYSPACWVCRSIGHQKNDCPTLRAYIEAGWVHLDSSNVLWWGTESNPQFRVSNLPMNQGRWAEVLSSEIKRQFLKHDVDPLTVKADWNELSNPSQPTTTNAMSTSLFPDSAGTLLDDSVRGYWEYSNRSVKQLERPSGTLLGSQVNNVNLKACASAVEGGSRTNQAGGIHKTIMKKPSFERIPHLRGHKNREDEYFLSRRQVKDRTVQFTGESDNNAMEDVQVLSPELQSDSKPEGIDAKDKPPRKHQLVKKLNADAHGVIQQILNSHIQLPLKAIIGNMPKVRKKLFQSGYTPEEFERLHVNAEALKGDSNSSEEQDDNRAQPLNKVSQFAGGEIPQFVWVEAESGQIVRCARIKADH
ncbi:hypothetical protein SLS61_001830 [Didymella pomorum]